MNKKTNKTEHVLKLLTGNKSSSAENPILNEEFKHDVIHTRNVSKPVEEKVKPDKQKAVSIEIMEALVNENILPAIKRFNACSCEMCRKEIAINTLRETKPIYIPDDEEHQPEIKMLKEKYKNGIVSQIVKSIIKLKSNPIHN